MKKIIYVLIYFFTCNYGLYSMDIVNQLPHLPASSEKSDDCFARLCKAMTQLKIGKAEGLISRHSDIVKKYGVCPLAGDMITPLIYLSRAEVWDGAKLLHVLLKAGADPNATDSNGNTFLHSAKKHIHTKHLAYLLKFGVNIDQKNKMGRTPLMQHVLYDSDIKEDIMRLSAAINTQDNDGKTVLHHAYQSGRLRFANLLLTDTDIDHQIVDNKGKVCIDVIEREENYPIKNRCLPVFDPIKKSKESDSFQLSTYYIEKLIQRIDTNNYDELICIHKLLQAMPMEQFMRKLESCDDYTKSLLCSIRNWRGIVFIIQKEQQRRKRERTLAIKDFIITSMNSHMTEVE